MKIATTYNNLARGKIDHDMQGRFDLPAYKNAADDIVNWFTDVKGNGIYSSGFEAMLEFQDCAFIEFKFAANQNYILVLYNTKMRFISYDTNGVFGWVLDGGASILEIDTPWDLAESKQIARTQSFTQNADYMIIAHHDHEPQQLVRVSANSFTLDPFARKGDPFPKTWGSAKNITAVTKAANAQVSIATHGYSVGDRVRITGITGMTELNNWTAAVLTVPTAGTFTIDVDTRGFTTYSSGGTAEKVLTGEYPARCLFYRARLYYANTAREITALWASEEGIYDIFTLPSSVTATSALKLVLADIAQPIDWLFPGENSLIVGAGDGIIPVNGGEVGAAITAESVDSILTTADYASDVAPIQKDNFIFYIGLERRNLYYFNYNLLREAFESADANFSSLDYTIGKIRKMRRVNDRFDLVYLMDDAGDLITLKFDLREDINVLAWHKRITEGTFTDIAQITNNEGRPELIALVNRGGTYYIERKAQQVEFTLRHTFFTNDRDADKLAFWRTWAEELKQCNYLDNSTSFSDLRTTAITYDSGAGTITDAGAGFVSGDVGKFIVYKTATGYESGRFEITGYTSSSVVSVSVIQTPTANSYSSWYLSFDTLTGLSRFNGLDIAIFADGGYLGDFAVSSGSCALGRQVTTALAGYKYRGVIKSMPQGTVVQQYNTHITNKKVVSAHVRASMSGGGKFGTSPYRLEEFQKLEQGHPNYLPPLPIDGVEKVNYADNFEVNKEWYFVQDEPLPFTLNALVIETSEALSP